MLFSTPVTCAGPLTCPHTSKLSLMFFNVRPAKGWPLTVGTDKSTTQRLREAREPGDVACAADEGRMICTELCPLIATELDVENDGLRMAAVLGFRRFLSALLIEPLAVVSRSALLLGSLEGVGTRFGVGDIEDSTDEGSER